MTKIVQTDRARQGGRGRQVLIVLVSALALSVLVWAGLELYGESIDETAQPAATQSDTPQSGNTQSGATQSGTTQSGTSTTTP